MVRVHPGREKISFYGTPNLLTGQEIARPSSVMNGEATAEHLQQILDSYRDVPIVLLYGTVLPGTLGHRFVSCSRRIPA